ncbi:MAG: lipoyl domain-containing protein [Candidatus Omnitrophica bacterium]|nr:lipoyl domain-containing protein [Candidatus Omnitrophota bacterium]
MRAVILPELGPAIEKAVVSFWFFKEGDQVKENEDLVELTTDKAAFNIPSPCNGILVEIFFREGDTVQVGEVLANIQELPEDK